MMQIKKKKMSRLTRLLLPLLCLLLAASAAGCGKKTGSGAGPRDSASAAAPQIQTWEGDADEEGGALQETDLQEEGGEDPDAYGDGSGEGSPGQDQGGGTQAGIFENGIYTTAEDVALYLHTYGRLPLNFITKKEARAKGWSGGSLEEYAPGMCIGGDRFGNYEGVLPDGNYHECDINTLGADRRGAERLVYADDGRIYYTNDHYETFTLLYGD